MNLGKLFLFTDEAIRYEDDGVELAIMPGMNTVRGRGHGFRFDAALSEIDFHVGEKAVLTHQGGASGVGFTFSLPDTVAKQIIEKRNQYMREAKE